MNAKKIFLAMCVLLSACTTAQQTKPTQWHVKATTAGDQKIWVTRADGSRQCTPKPKESLPATAAAELKSAGILVFQAKAGNDGQMHAQNCGSPTGSTVDAEISRSDLSKALSLGFVSKATASE